VAVCPADAVRHSEFPHEKVHHTDRSKLPSPEQVLLLCRARRSNRALLQKPVPTELIDQILEAAHRAPTASNNQRVSFTVITDPATIDRVIEFTMDKFGGMIKMLENPFVKMVMKPLKPEYYGYVPAFRRMEQKQKLGIDGVLRGARTLVLIHTPRENRFGFADANLAYQNGSLMAETLGVSQIYTGFVLMALKMDKGGKFLRTLGIEGEVHAGMALGMPQFLYNNYIDRKPIEVRRI
jgi:nitroreductase